MLRATLDHRLQNLAGHIGRAGVTYDLWWLIAGVDTRKPFAPTFKQYGSYFVFLEYSLLGAVVLQASIPFDHSKGASSLYRLVKDMGAYGQITPTIATQLNERLASVHDQLRRTRLLRNRAFAHLQDRTSPLALNQAFTEAGLQPAHMRDLIETAREVVNALLAASGGQPVVPNEFPAEDGLMILQDLAAFAKL